jgi:hypothetical protein
MLIEFLKWLIVFAIVVVAVVYVIDLIPLPPPINRLAKLLLGALALILFLEHALPVLGVHGF